MPSLWLVTPAFRRFELTRICLTEHQWALAQLRAHGIDGVSCVIADDDNLATAEALGCATVRRSNRRLGAKFNDGYQFALAEGADYVFPIGSDSWLDPAPLADALTRPHVHPDDALALVVIRYMAVVDPDATRRAELHVTVRSGVSWAAPTVLTDPYGGRPLPEQLQSLCDSAALHAFERATQRLGLGMRYRYTDGHPLEMVGWKSHERGITPYERLRDRWATAERPHPFVGLSAVYPRPLVEAMRAFYGAAP